MRLLCNHFACAALVALAPFVLAQSPTPPVAKRIPKITEIHGDKLTDHYYWLREKTSPEVMAHLDAENAYAEAIMKPTASLQEKLYEEFLSRIQQTDLSVPIRERGFWYYTRTEKGKQYPIHCRKVGTLDAPEQVLLDVNVLAQGQKFMEVADRAVSDDDHLLAYAVDTKGFREYTLCIKDLRTGKMLPDAIANVTAVVWAADNKTLFYVTEDHAKRPYRLFRHTLGEPQEKDVLLYEEKDELYNVDVRSSKDRTFLFAVSASSTTTEVHYLKRDRPADALRVVLPREEDHRYDVEHRGGQFLLRTNKGAKNFRLVTAPLATPSQENWQELIPHRPEVLLSAVHSFAGHLVLEERFNGLDRIVVFNPSSGKRTEIAFKEPTYDVSDSPNPEFDSKTFRFQYQSFTTPKSIFEYDIPSGERQLLKRTEVLGGYDPNHYHSERLWATASDGVKVPISIVYKKGVKLDGTAPMLLYGYGAYGLTDPASFSEIRFSLLDGGKVLTKRNSFTDFIACAEHLIAQKYASPQKLAIQGRSAGGLLIGSVLTLRPDLPKVAVLEVPFLEVINTMLDETIPLTVPEFLEWGNPKNPKHYPYMKSYCPYTNLREINYPSILVVTSFHDSQVMYWEPAKYVAKMRSVKKDANPLVFKCNMTAGHGGASGRYDNLRERAFVFAFVLKELGVER
jgi:oligopeptidase B